MTTLSVEDAELALIAVSDNGKGFPHEDRHRLIEPYVTTRAEGTGLGPADRGQDIRGPWRRRRPSRRAAASRRRPRR